MNQTIKLLLQKPIAFHRIFADIAGSVAGGLFLSQLYYWNDKGNRDDGYIYKTFEQWKEETGLSRREWENARKILKRKGIVDSRRMGTDPQLYYKINIDALYQEIISLSEEENSQDATLPNAISDNAQRHILHSPMSDVTMGNVKNDIGSIYTENTDKDYSRDYVCRGEQKKQNSTHTQKANYEEKIFEPEVVVSPQQQNSNSRIDQKPINQNEETNIELNVPPCNTSVTPSVTRPKAWYSLRRKDFKWLNELWAKYRFDWESADSVFLSDRVLASLKEGYKIVGEDMGMIHRLVENSLKWRAINADYHNKDLDYFLVNQNYLSFGRKPLTPVLAKSHKQQEKDSNQARQAMIAMEEAKRYM